MPKRVIDADAMWKSTKLGKCRDKSIPEYAWLYGLADANGNFELTNLRAIHSDAYASIRPNFTVHDLREVIDDFERHGLLFVWDEGIKKYGHWTGSEKPGRLPPRGQRPRYSGNLSVRALYDSSGTVIDPALAEYLERSANTEAEPQLALPLPTAHQVRKQAERSVDDLQTRARQTVFNETQQANIDNFRKFQNLYPPAGFVREVYTRDLLAKVSQTEIADVFAGLEKHLASQSWREGYVVDSDRFLEERYWAKPPRETTNGKRVLGPAGRTTEEHRERMRKNAKTLGLDHP